MGAFVSGGSEGIAGPRLDQGSEPPADERTVASSASRRLPAARTPVLGRVVRPVLGQSSLRASIRIYLVVAFVLATLVPVVTLIVLGLSGTGDVQAFWSQQLARSYMLAALALVLVVVVGLGLAVTRWLADPLAALARTAEALGGSTPDSGPPTDTRPDSRVFTTTPDTQALVHSPVREVASLAQALQVLQEHLATRGRAAADLEQPPVNQALPESVARYAVAVRGSNDGLWDWDLRTDTLHCSERWRGIVGVDRRERPESSAFWFDRVHPDDVQHLRNALDEQLRGDVDHFECEARMLSSNGSYRWALCRGLAVRDSAGTPVRIAGSLSDITDRRLAEERLLHDAMHDALTGLPNRALFLDRLQPALRRAQRYGGRHFAVLCMDLDRFKVINDSLGHAVGDELLVAVARRVIACVGEADTVARLGGDEFGILLEDLEHDDEAVQIAERIQHVLRVPCELSSHSVVVTASIGIVPGPDEYQQPTDLLRDADIAMYRAKELGHARHVVFDASLRGQALALLALESDLRRALERGELLLHYQPIVRAVDNTITGMEALARWPHPRRGMVPPMEFISYAEESGLILPLGDWVLRSAIQQMRTWEQQRLAPDRVCVNLSARQLHQPDLVERVAALLREHGLGPERLEIELTENVVVQHAETTVQALRRLRELGVRITVDDFGTGYSSLAYLTRFPVSTVKIDRTFIVDIVDNRVNQAIVNAVTTLAHAIGMCVVAEGVETPQQRALALQLGCDELQGYLVSQPLASDAATTWLERAQGSTLGV